MVKELRQANGEDQDKNLPNSQNFCCSLCGWVTVLQF
jgi:hypothetical protein